LLGTALGLALTADQTAYARLHKLKVTIAEGIAPVTLGEFVRQTGLQILFETDAIRDHRTRAVSGQFEAAEALHLMLEGSGLIFEFINERTIAVRPGALRPGATKVGLRRNPGDGASQLP
jgi:iron complex outermembrane receptor protein